MKMEATDAGWILLDEKVDTSKLPVDTKSVKFKMGTEGALRVVNPRTNDNPSLGLMYLEDDVVIEKHTCKKMRGMII